MAIQYTIRNVPPEVDRALKQRSRITRKSFNQTVIEELSKNVAKPNSNRFDWMLGTLSEEEARLFDSAIEELNKPNPEFWQ